MFLLKISDISRSSCPYTPTPPPPPLLSQILLINSLFCFPSDFFFFWVQLLFLKGKKNYISIVVWAVHLNTHTRRQYNLQWRVYEGADYVLQVNCAYSPTLNHTLLHFPLAPPLFQDLPVSVNKWQELVSRATLRVFLLCLLLNRVHVFANLYL